jgi:hypothetical protein
MSAHSHLRDLSAVLIRRLLLVDEPSVWENMTPEGHVQLKEALLMSVESEVITSIRLHVCDTVTDLALGTLPNDQPWPTLFAKMDGWVNGANLDLKEASLFVFGLMGDYFANVRRVERKLELFEMEWRLTFFLCFCAMRHCVLSSVAVRT